LVLEDAWQSCLDDCVGHQGNVEDSSQKAAVVRLDIGARVENEPTHAPSWSQVSLSQAGTLEDSDFVNLFRFYQVGESGRFGIVAHPLVYLVSQDWNLLLYAEFDDFSLVLC
jgi:hypothetical protein